MKGRSIDWSLRGKGLQKGTIKSYPDGIQSRGRPRL